MSIIGLLGVALVRRMVQRRPVRSRRLPQPATKAHTINRSTSSKSSEVVGERFKIAPPPTDAADLRGDDEPARLQTMPFKAITQHEEQPLTVEQAFAQHYDNVLVTTGGTVTKLLRTDTVGARHQKFIIRLASGKTLLITHNIDDAPRVPVQVGDQVRVRGRYIWGEEGGELHWTHHDPYGRVPGGWIELERTGGHYE